MKYVVLGRIEWRKGEVPRPLRINMKNPIDRRLLSRAKDLKIGMEKDYIVPDLIKVQQESDKKLKRGGRSFETVRSSRSENIER